MKNDSEKEKQFALQIGRFAEDYDLKMIDAFFNYWSEPNQKGKMKWELEKTWDTKRRLKRWFDNQNKWNGTNKAGTSAARIETARKW